PCRQCVQLPRGRTQPSRAQVHAPPESPPRQKEKTQGSLHAHIALVRQPSPCSESHRYPCKPPSNRSSWDVPYSTARPSAPCNAWPRSCTGTRDNEFQHLQRQNRHILILGAGSTIVLYEQLHNLASTIHLKNDDNHDAPFRRQVSENGPSRRDGI